MGITLTQGSLFLKRVGSVVSGKKRLSGLYGLARASKRMAGQCPGADLLFNFINREAKVWGIVKPFEINRTICELMRKKGIDSILIDMNGTPGSGAVIPDRILKATVRCVLRHLSMHGLPPEGDHISIVLSHLTFNLLDLNQINAFALLARSPSIPRGAIVKIFSAVEEGGPWGY